jgi:hypothetical protein
VGRLDLACTQSLDLRRAGALVLESVFDEILCPAALRVMTAALDLAWTTP